MKQEKGHDPTEASRTPATPADRDLTPKKMSDSYHRVVIPLAQDPWLLDSYLNASGHIRLGTIFMDLDALSGIIAYKHTGEDVTTVTAAVDRITIKHPLREICDLELSGQVTYATGRSSMETSLQVAKAPKDGEMVRKEDVLVECAFTMVSLDPGTKKPVQIAPLKVDTAEERRLFDLGEKNSKEKKRLARTALLKQTPNDEESDLIHALWLRQLEYHDPNLPIRKPDNVVYMDMTKIHSSQIMQPQYRNRHNFMIFGGFLLKQTFELAFCCAASFSHTRPSFISLDPSTFENPVPVGSVLYLTATVAYTDPPLVSENEDSLKKDSGFTRVQVRVDSKVRDVEHGHTKPTGQFSYTFLVGKNLKVLPRTYSEFMIWLDAKRRAERVSSSIDPSGNSVGKDGPTDNPRDRFMK
ncbi:MAG: hypothetical protein M1835_001020 [Candelina submexicana]|nr:MAG: hypothetical protein M1835_001020 [Candelina submexicana]